MEHLLDYETLLTSEPKPPKKLKLRVRETPKPTQLPVPYNPKLKIESDPIEEKVSDPEERKRL